MSTIVCHICEHLIVHSTHNAPKRYHLRFGSHSSGLQHSKHAGMLDFQVAEHGRITQLLRKCQKVEKPRKPRFAWIFMVFMVFHDFGKKCSTIAEKVVSKGGRDQKSTV